MSDHEQIPLLDRFDIWYVCDVCDKPQMLVDGFYADMDKICDACRDGALICPECGETLPE